MTCITFRCRWLAPSGIPASVFLFFSSRLGCLGSLVISLALTALLLFLLGIL